MEIKALKCVRLTLFFESAYTPNTQGISTLLIAKVDFSLQDSGTHQIIATRG